MRCYTEIDGIQVDSKILTAKFSCDYERCKGACCNQPIPDIQLNGGALSVYDAAEILYHRTALSSLCDRENQQIVLRQPVSKGSDGEFYTTLHKDRCVLCNMQKGICALKLAKAQKITDVDIPLSCQLYPIVWEVYPTYERLRVETLFDKYCVSAYEKGQRDNVLLLDFLKDPLVRGFGEEFYTKLKELQREFI